MANGSQIPDKFVVFQNIPGVGVILAFMPAVVNALRDRFEALSARQAAEQAATQFQAKGWLVEVLEPVRVPSHNGTRIPNFIPALHILNATGDYSGVVVFDAGHNALALQTGRCEIIKL